MISKKNTRGSSNNDLNFDYLLTQSDSKMKNNNLISEECVNNYQKSGESYSPLNLSEMF